MRNPLARLARRDQLKVPLRERAALLKASATRALRLTDSASPTELQADPILAAIEETRRLCAEHNAACNTATPPGESDPPEVIARRSDACDDLYAHIDDVLLKTVPTTARGCAALARYVGEYVADQGVPLCAATENNDPVFALIARSPLL